MNIKSFDVADRSGHRGFFFFIGFSVVSLRQLFLCVSRFFTSAVSFVPAVSFATVVSFTSAVSLCSGSCRVQLWLRWLCSGKSMRLLMRRTPAKAAVNNKFFS